MISKNGFSASKTAYSAFFIKNSPASDNSGGHPSRTSLSSELQRLAVTWTLAIFLILSIPLPQNTTPDFHFQGKRTLIDRDTTDLDDGLNETLIDESNDGILRSPLSFDGSDFWYGWDGKAERLHPQHGAQLARGGTAEAGY